MTSIADSAPGPITARNARPGVVPAGFHPPRSGSTDNTTTLASTGFSSQTFSANSIDTRELVSEGVLKSGLSSPSEATFVLKPAVDYVLRMTVLLNGASCTASSPFIWNSSLSYIQLGKP